LSSKSITSTIYYPNTIAKNNKKLPSEKFGWQQTGGNKQSLLGKAKIG